MNILGISCFYHDSAAALLRDGELVAAAHEERFTRKRHDPDFPRHAIGVLPREGRPRRGRPRLRRLLRQAASSSSSGSCIDLPRHLPALAALLPQGDADLAEGEALGAAARSSKELGYEGEVLFAEHHQSHAASAFLPSPFEEAAILTFDGVGEWATATYGRRARATTFELIKEIRFPHSPGPALQRLHLLPRLQGQQRRVQGDGRRALRRSRVLRDRSSNELVDLRDDGSFKLDMKYFAYDYGLTHDQRALRRRSSGGRGASPRSEMERVPLGHGGQRPEGDRGGRAAHGARPPPAHRAHEPVHGRRRRAQLRGQRPHHPRGPLRGALGAARGGRRRAARSARRSSSTTRVLGAARAAPAWTTPTWGPSFSDEEIRELPRRARRAVPDARRATRCSRETARLLDEEQAVVGWFQGRMEWGPRALGQPQHPRRRAQRGELEAREPEDQVPRELPALRAGVPGREGLGVVRHRPREPVHAAGLPGAGGPRRSPPSPTWTAPRGSRRSPATPHPEFYDLLAAFDQQHRLPGADQHLVQRPRRADRLHARGRLPVLHAHEHGRAGARATRSCDKEEQPELREDVDWRELYELD